jgi:hypothetical protein
MAVELSSRILAILAAAAFSWVLSGRQLPLVPRGRWTVAALFAVGLGMCTLAGTRDVMGPTLTQPAWLTAVFAGLGVAAAAVLLGVIIGLNWRVGVVSLAIVTASSWLLALGYGIYLGLDSTVSGVIALVVAAAAALFAWRAPRALHGASTAASI